MLSIKGILIFVCFFHITFSWKSTDDNRCLDIPYSNLCIQLGSKYYLVNGNDQLNWYDAERFCRRQNGFLANIESSNELSLISAYLKFRNFDQGEHWFWIAGNDLGSPDKFYSISTGQLMPFTDWTSGQPDNAGGNENCVQLWKSSNGFGMNDNNCDSKIHFICELNISNDRPVYDIQGYQHLNEENDTISNLDNI